MKPAGGTEILHNNLLKYVGSDWSQQLNLIVSTCKPEFVDPNKINVVWQHLAYDQANIIGMAYPEFIQSVDHFVYVSQWQLDEFSRRFSTDLSQNHVIRNAIDPIEFKTKPTDKIKLIYTSTPNRGLKVLLEAWRILNRQDVELHVYSSDVIYGTGYAAQRAREHAELFHRCKTTQGIVYKGYATNKAVRQALQSAHILAYPSIYEETSCLAAIEAGAAGCRIVTTDLGALPETCDQWARYVDYAYGDDLTRLAEKYAAALNEEIDLVSQNVYNLQEQSLWFNANYSWEHRAQEWKEFLKNA
jgi:glycosyltransferase involved in cell wall biosynthesis